MSEQSASARDRRRHGRKAVLESGVLFGDAGPIDCQVTDISAGGARVRPVQPLDGADGVRRFELARLGPFEAEIRWRADGSAGLRFLLEPAVTAERCHMLLEPEPRAGALSTAR